MTVILTNAQAASGDLIQYSNQSLVQNTPSVPSERLRSLARQSKTVLLRINNLFPFDLFPDTLIVDEHKVTIIHRNLFGVCEVHSVLISDITDVVVYTTLFLSSLIIIDSSNYRFPIDITIRYLLTADAFKAREIIQGLIAAHRQHVELDQIPYQEVVDRVSRVGEVS